MGSSDSETSQSVALAGAEVPRTLIEARIIGSMPIATDGWPISPSSCRVSTPFGAVYAARSATGISPALVAGAVIGITTETFDRVISAPEFHTIVERSPAFVPDPIATVAPMPKTPCDDRAEIGTDAAGTVTLTTDVMPGSSPATGARPIVCAPCTSSVEPSQVARLLRESIGVLSIHRSTVPATNELEPPLVTETCTVRSCPGARMPPFSGATVTVSWLTASVAALTA